MNNHNIFIAKIPEPVWRISANLLLIGLWAWFFRPVFPYLRVIFTREEFRTNQILLVAIIFLIISQAKKGVFKPRFDQPAQIYLPAFVFILIGSFLFLINERFLDINTLSASMFALASYGLLGLWMHPSRWKQGLPAALLLIGVLPFGEHMQTFVGYPVRIFTAALVGEGLAALGVHSLGIDSILVFENGIAQVDLPCSGVKSLWTGGLFLIAITWIEQRSINLGWIFVALIFSLLLLVGNLVRVAVLVVVGQVMEWRLLAEMLHVPLGVLSFAAACVAAVWMLRFRRLDFNSLEGLPAMPPETSRTVWLVPALSILIIFMSLLYIPRPQTAAAQSSPEWQLPENLNLEAWPLSAKEQSWINEGGADLSTRWRFNWQGQTGSILLVSSTTWRAHHHPERCFQVFGLEVNESQTYLVSPDFSLRLLSLGKDRKRGLFSAVYWLQSADQATDDYAVRIWSDLDPQRKPWVQATILFDNAGSPLSDQSLELYNALRRSIQTILRGGTK